MLHQVDLKMPQHNECLRFRVISHELAPVRRVIALEEMTARNVQQARS